MKELSDTDKTWLQIIGLLRKEGWVEQRGGMAYFNGEYATNYAKDGEVIHISRVLYMDDEEYEDLFKEGGEA